MGQCMTRKKVSSSGSTTGTHTRQKQRSPRRKMFRSSHPSIPTFAMLNPTSSNLSCLQKDPFRRSTNEPRNMTRSGFGLSSPNTRRQPPPTADLLLQTTMQTERGPTLRHHLHIPVKHGPRAQHLPTRLNALNHRLITIRHPTHHSIRMPIGVAITAQPAAALCVLALLIISSIMAPTVSNRLLASIRACQSSGEYSPTTCINETLEYYAESFCPPRCVFHLKRSSIRDHFH
jgi:hypothetical protein